MPWVCAKPLDTMLDEDAPGRACERICDAAGDRLLATTKRLTPIDRSPFRDKPTRPRGTARESLERTPVRRGGNQGRRYTTVVQTFDPAFPYIEFNTRPHVIRPRADRRPASVVATGRPRGTVKDGRAALTWRGPGGRVFAREVHHPGTQGQHPFARAALQLTGTVGQVASEPMRRFKSELARSIP